MRVIADGVQERQEQILQEIQQNSALEVAISNAQNELDLIGYVGAETINLFEATARLLTFKVNELKKLSNDRRGPLEDQNM